MASRQEADGRWQEGTELERVFKNYQDLKMISDDYRPQADPLILNYTPKKHKNFGTPDLVLVKKDILLGLIFRLSFRQLSSIFLHVKSVSPRWMKRCYRCHTLKAFIC